MPISVDAGFTLLKSKLKTFGWWSLVTGRDRDEQLVRRRRLLCGRPLLPAANTFRGAV
jgi:hypothetical protein